MKWLLFAVLLLPTMLECHSRGPRRSYAAIVRPIVQQCMVAASVGFAQECAKGVTTSSRDLARRCIQKIIRALRGRNLTVSVSIHAQ